MVLLGGVALGAQPPIVVKLSCRRSVGRSVCRSVRCIVENGGSDPDTVWYHRSDWSRNEAGSGVWRSVLLGAHLGRAIVTNGDFTAWVCDSASTVGAAVWGGACGWPRHFCIRWGSTSSKGKGRFWGFLFSIFTMKDAIASPTVKCFRFVCEHFTTFLFGKHIVGKLDSWAFW